MSKPGDGRISKHLLSADGADGGPLGGDADHPFDAEELARYRDGQVVARGGMGQVSAVTDARLRRQVAMKEAVTDDLGGAGLERRLAQEAWITAQLEHPGIVPVYDAGRGVGGRPFFTMRLIRGRSLATALSDGDLDEGTLLRHFLAVCQAMAYAHAMGVVHRDLKPANIMLGEFGETQIVDWGLARSVDAAGTEDDRSASDLVPDALAARTMHGARVGTPAYMSPEQADAGVVGRAADVWSLGAILFEILTGRAPFAGATTAEIFARLTRGPVPRVEHVHPDASPELAAVAAHALRLDPAARYVDAKHLAADVAAYLDGRRVRAFDYSAWDLVKRFGRAFRVPLIAAALAFVAIGVVFSISYAQTRDERDRAQAAEARATSSRDRAVAAEHRTADALADADRSFAALLVRGAQEATHHDAQAEAEVLAAHALLRGPSPEARGVLARWSGTARPRLFSAEPAPRCVSARLGPAGRQLLCSEADAVSLWRVAPLRLIWRAPLRLDEVAFLSRAQALVEGPSWARTAVLDLETGVTIPLPRRIVVGRALAAAGRALVDTVELAVWEPGTGRYAPIDGPLRQPRAISGDGRVAVIYDETTARVSRLDLVTETVTELPPIPFRAGRGPMSAALDHDGRRVAFGSTEGDLLVVDASSCALAWREAVTDRALTHVSWSPDDRWLAARDERGWLSLWSVAGRVRLALPRLRASDFAWRSDGGAPALVVLGDEVRVYRLPETVSASRYPASAGLSELALSPDGSLLALPDGDGVVRVYDVESGALSGELAGDGHAVAKSAAFLRDGSDRTLVIAWPGRSVTGTWRVGRETHVIPTELDFRRVVGTASGGFAAASYGHVVAGFSGDTQTWWAPPTDGGLPIDLAASRDGRTLAWLSSRGGVEVAALLEDDQLGPVRTVFDAPRARALALDGHGTRVALASGRILEVVDVASGAVLRTLTGDHVVDVALSADGELLAAGMLNGTVWVWGADGAEPLMIGAAHTERASGVAFGPDGRWLVSVGWDGIGLRWDLRALDTPPEALVADLERTWGVSLQHATRADLR